MKWVRFERDGRQGIGMLQGESGKSTVSVQSVQPVEAASLQEVIAGQGTQPVGAAFSLNGVDGAGDANDAGGARLLAPLRPGKIICVGLNYWDHCREQKVDPPKKPVLFAKFPLSVIGPLQEVRWSQDLTSQVDYEAEMALVIGKTARRVREDDALDYLFGYTAANDVSARDVQFGDGQWLRGKAIDTFCPLGPAVATRDEVSDPQNLSVKCRVNGVTLQDSNTKEMIFPVRHLIAFISHAITLEPGDVVLTGTPHGVGVFRNPKIFLKPGDQMEVEVEPVGVLKNTIGAFLA